MGDFKDLARRSLIPWCIIGDFNDLMHADEKWGERAHPRSLLDGFVDTIRVCGLSDLGFVREKFTWERFRGKSNWVQERLDRGFANQVWRELFPVAEVKVWDVSTSDHLPLYLQTNKRVYVPKAKRFRFENVWIREKECLTVVKNSWESAASGEIMEKIRLCCLKLEEWGGGLSSEYQGQIKESRIKIRRLRSRRDTHGIKTYNEVRWRYLELLERQESYWCQFQ